MKISEYAEAVDDITGLDVLRVAITDCKDT